VALYPKPNGEYQCELLVELNSNMQACQEAVNY